MIKIKVCGLREIENLNEVGNLNVHFVGLNFYHKSKRFIDHSDACKLSNYKAHLKVGVFVNAKKQYLLDMVKIYRLDYVQLHGLETPEFVEEVSAKVKVIKVFSINNKEDFQNIDHYKHCEYFLFDTKTPLYGGSGKMFDWSLLDNYHGDTDFFLAGGITMDSIEAIKQLKHPLFKGVDINSGFEIEPGLKHIGLIQQFIKLL